MIRAYLDGNELQLYPETGIGMTLENFNVSDIQNRRIDITNQIQIPKAGNEQILEFSSHPNAPTDFPYNDYDFDLIVDGIQVYKNGRAFIVSESDDSYLLNITNNKNIIDLLKSIELKDLYDTDEITLINTTTWANLFKQKTSGFKIDFFFNDTDTPTTDTFNFIAGANPISIYLDTILAKIATDYSVSFSGNLLSDSDFLEMRIPMVQSMLYRDNGSTDIYIAQIVIHDSLTAWDLIKNILKLFCGVFKIDGTDVELQKFDDLDTTTPLDWSNKLKTKTKSFTIPGIAQKNYLRYSADERIDPSYASKTIECNNTNIDYEIELDTLKFKLFELRDFNSYFTNASANPLWNILLPKNKIITGLGGSKPGLLSKIEKSRGLKDLVVVVDSAEYLGQPLTISMKYYYDTTGTSIYLETTLNGSLTSDADTTIIEYYDISSNYTLLETMFNDPVHYDAELMLNLVDINQFDNFKAVKIDELEGLFYINKIQDFLITSPGNPTKVELIKIS